MSSLTLSGVVLLLRITLALPVTRRDVADRLLGRLRISGGRGGIGRRGRRCGGLCRIGLCLRQLRRFGRACETFRRADHRAAGQQRKREGQSARHRGISVHGEGRRRGFRFQPRQAECGMNATLVVRRGAKRSSATSGDWPGMALYYRVSKDRSAALVSGSRFERLVRVCRSGAPFDGRRGPAAVIGSKPPCSRR